KNNNKMSAKPTCLIVASASPQGVSAKSFLQCFSLCSTAFNLQTATPGGKPIDFVGVDESTARWVQDFNVKSYATPAKLESIDGARYQALLIPDCPGAPNDLAHSGSMHRILTQFISQQSEFQTCVNVFVNSLSARCIFVFSALCRARVCCWTGRVGTVLCYRGAEVDLQWLQLNRG
uniref:Glutamine amidotransferase-like class 1 domain-containing protein 1 n=1 Tax=Poecilia mexicana TaxID=48701 RepID=A0A3B3XS29_9TELE